MEFNIQSQSSLIGEKDQFLVDGSSSDCSRANISLRESIDRQVIINDKCWIYSKRNGRSWAHSRTKRCFEALLAVLGLIAIFPLFGLIAVAIKLDSEGPVFFKQNRTGYMGRRFGLYKFRTMVKDAEKMKKDLMHLNHHAQDSPDFKIQADPRVTRVGRLLRRFSLDELPNLINVVIGDLRLVGPRPTSFCASTYEESHLVRLSVKPGITGLWQISGRSSIDFGGRVALDRYYIEKQSLAFDLKIMFLTPYKIIEGKGAC